MANIGLFGGTFDPIHLGHLKTVQEVQNSFGLETVYLIPASQPPHKTDRTVAPAADRMAMLQIALDPLHRLAVSEAEINRTGLSYSVETVAEFKRRFSGTASLFFIIGQDAFVEIHTWKAYRDLLAQVSFIVMTRPGAGKGLSSQVPTSLQAFLDARISDGYIFDSATNLFQHPSLQPVRLFETTPVNISSTGIREKIKARQKFEHLLPEGVAAYITRKGLYR